MFVLPFFAFGFLILYVIFTRSTVTSDSPKCFLLQTFEGQHRTLLHATAVNAANDPWIGLTRTFEVASPRCHSKYMPALAGF